MVEGPGTVRQGTGSVGERRRAPLRFGETLEVALNWGSGFFIAPGWVRTCGRQVPRGGVLPHE